MARKRGKNRRRRRGRFSVLLRLFCVLLIIGALIAALTLFFKVQSIVVSGNERYTDAEVIEASGIHMEDNLFLLNKYGVTQTIFETLPYIEEAAVNRKLPDAIVITVRECTAVAGIVVPEGVWLVSESGKLLELAQSVPQGCPAVTGAVPVEPELSGMLSFGTERESAVDTLLALLRAARAQEMLAGIGGIDLSDATEIRLEYLDRFSVRLPWGSDPDYKLRSLRAVADYLELNEAGEINLMADGKASFIPKE